MKIIERLAVGGVLEGENFKEYRMSTDKTCFLCGRSCDVRYGEVLGIVFYECTSCGTYGLDNKTKLRYERCIDEKERASPSFGWSKKNG